LRLVTDGLDIVPVRIEDDCAVVVWMIVGADSRLAVVAAARGHRSGIKGIDLGALVRSEGMMPAGSGPARRKQPELRPVVTIAADPDPAGIFQRHHHDEGRTKRRQRGVVKLLRSIKILNCNAGMIDHRFTSQVVMRSPVTGSLPSLSWTPC